MVEKTEGPDFWPDNGQLEELQRKLGYYFADTQHLYDALDISNRGDPILKNMPRRKLPWGDGDEIDVPDQVDPPQTFEGRKHHARKRKVLMGKELLSAVLGFNVYDSNVKSRVVELTRGRELWNQQGAVVVAAKSLGLGEMLMRRNSQKLDDNELANTLSDTFSALLRAVYEDMHEQGYSDDAKIGEIRRIIRRYMPIMQSFPLDDVSRADSASGEIRNEVIDMLQASEEFKDRGLAFIWEPIKERITPNGPRYSQKLQLVQMKKDPETRQATDEIEEHIMEVTGYDTSPRGANASTSKKMVNQMMGTHYFSEILRAIGTTPDASQEKGL